MAEDTTNLVTINIDGKDYQVAAKQNLVDAAQSVGIEIPHYCYHPKLPMAGSCRMCLVEIGMPMRDRATGEPVIDEATGKQKIGWMPKPAIACGTSVSPGLHVKLNSKMTVSSREGVTEFSPITRWSARFATRRANARFRNFLLNTEKAFRAIAMPKT